MNTRFAKLTAQCLLAGVLVATFPALLSGMVALVSILSKAAHAFLAANLTLQYLVMAPIAIFAGIALIYSRYNEPSVFDDEDYFIERYDRYVLKGKREASDYIMRALRVTGLASLLVGALLIVQLIPLVPLQILAAFGTSLGVTIVGWLMWLITGVVAVSVYFGKEHIRSMFYSLVARMHIRDCYYGQIVVLSKANIRGRIARVGICFARIYTGASVEYRDILVSELYDSGLGYSCSITERVRPIQ